ncbi:unnamed protein product [Phytophthora fragariaefolia]|uniref:Unnamed protein product n=1 Tax=Phytophthora fragariaefolia TaxID=1490495 RepID=A0A9W6UB86_9STRA|nr:unnamed protein product [Phytophthora fragariaefolia]
MTRTCGSTVAIHEPGGCRWLNMSDAIDTTGSWKTRMMRKTCKEVDVSADNEATDGYRATTGVLEVGVGMVLGPHGLHVRSDVQHDKTRGSEIWKASELCDGAHFSTFLFERKLRPEQTLANSLANE